jgi:hypothetical protein
MAQQSACDSLLPLGLPSALPQLYPVQESPVYTLPYMDQMAPNEVRPSSTLQPYLQLNYNLKKFK